MDLLIVLASLTVALWFMQQLKMPFPSNLAAAALVALVAYVLLWSLAVSIVSLLVSVTQAASSVPAVILLAFLLGVAAGFCLGRRRSAGGGDPFESL